MSIQFLLETSWLVDERHLPVAFKVWPGCTITVCPEEGLKAVANISEGSPITASSGGTLEAEATAAIAAMARVKARITIGCL